MEILTKTKILVFCGEEPIRSKICINDTVLERVNEFNSLGFKHFFLPYLDTSQQIFKFIKSIGIINNVMKPSLVQKHICTCMYKTCPLLWQWSLDLKKVQSTAVVQVVACVPVTQRARVRYPVGTSFLGEVFSGFFLTCKTNVRKL